MPLVRAQNCDFNYQVDGEGPPILFVHGESQTSELFADQAAHFARSNRCVRYDRRGHGRSQVTSYGYSHVSQTQDVAALVDILGLQQVTIVAAGMASTLAVAFALQNPERVRSLVLCSWYELDGYVAIERRRPKERPSFADIHLDLYELVRRRGRAALEEYIADYFTNKVPIFPTADQGANTRLTKMFADQPPEHYLWAAELYASLPALTPQLNQLQCPVLGIVGGDDPANFDLTGHGPNFKQVIIKGTRRFPMVEKPAEFNDALRDFLT